MFRFGLYYWQSSLCTRKTNAKNVLKDLLLGQAAIGTVIYNNLFYQNNNFVYMYVMYGDITILAI